MSFDIQNTKFIKLPKPTIFVQFLFIFLYVISIPYYYLQYQILMQKDKNCFHNSKLIKLTGVKKSYASEPY